MKNQFEIGSRLTVDIEKLSQGGDGIARVSAGPVSFVIFVPYSVTGDRLEIEIVERKKNFARGRIIKVLKENPARMHPPCPYHFSAGKREWCGGCDFQHIKYQFQLLEKLNSFKETLEKIAGISADCVLPVEGMKPGAEWRFRNKIQVPVGNIGRKAGGRIIAGFYAPYSHNIIPIDDCLIQSEEMMSVLKSVRGKMEEWGISAYSEISNRGWLRHLFLRQDNKSRKMLVTFVVSSEDASRKNDWVKHLTKEFPFVSGICQNLNAERTNVIFGARWKTLAGHNFLVESLDGLGSQGAALKLKVSVSSFFQVNTKMAEVLYRAARDFARGEDGKNGETLLDLYCGVGGIGLSLAPYFESVLGVEESYSAVSDAKENAALNNIHNCAFFAEDARSFLNKHSFLGDQMRNTVVLDPPRSGCSEDVLRRIVKLAPGKIVYVSCEPSTLARDIKFLSGHGFRLKKVQPVDMFPQSSHIESVSLLTR